MLLVLLRATCPRIVPALALASFGAAVFPGPARCETTYSVEILGTFRTDGSGASNASGINADGTVVGSAADSVGMSAFRWRSDSGLSNRGRVVPPYDCYAYAINSAGTMCGMGLSQSTGFGVAFRESPAGPIQALARFVGGGDAFAYGVSDSGICVGWGNGSSGCGSPECPGNPGRAVRWDTTGVLAVLPDLGGYYSAATDVSPDGTQICGHAADLSGHVRAFRLASGAATALPPLAGYDDSQAWGVNDAGQVVGFSVTGSSRRATLWNATTPIDLGTVPGASGSVAVKINASGVIVGYSVTPGGTYRAATFAPASPPTDVNAVLDLPSPFTLLYCNDVNDGGQIVGVADSSGTSRGFVLTPLGTTAVGPERGAAALELRCASRNPSRAGATFRLVLGEPGRIRLELLDVAGRVVARAGDAWFPAGEHAVAWDGRDLSGARVGPGVYLARLTSAGRAATTKFVVRP